MVIVLYGGICLDKGVRIGGTGGFCLVKMMVLVNVHACYVIGMAAVCSDGYKIESLDIFCLTFLQPYHFAFYNYTLPAVSFHFIGTIRERKWWILPTCWHQWWIPSKLCTQKPNKIMSDKGGKCLSMHLKGCANSTIPNLISNEGEVINHHMVYHYSCAVCAINQHVCT